MNRSIQIASAAVAVLFAATALAQTTDTWTASSGSWSTAANWSSGVPVSGGTTSLFFGGTTWSSSDDIAGAFQLNNLTFDNSGPCTILPTSPANYLNFVANGATTPSITLNGAGNVTISSFITLTSNLGISGAGGAGAMTLSGSITGAGGMTVNSGAMLTLSNTGNTFSGGINLNGGTVAVSSISDLGSGTNTLTFNNGGELLYTGASVDPKVFNYTFNGNGTIAVSNPTSYYEIEPGASANKGLFSGGGTITIAGSGEVFVHSSNSGFSGQIIVAPQATFALASWRFPGASGLTVQPGGQLEWQNNNGPASYEDLTLTGSGMITLNGTGPANPAGITGNSGALLYAPYSTVYTGGYVIAPVYLQTTSSIVVGNGGTSSKPVTNELQITGNISGPGGLTKDYVSGLISGRQNESAAWGNAQGILYLAGSNSYQGTTTINSGTILLGSPNALPNTPLMLNSSYDGSSTLDLGGFSATVASLSAAGTGSAVISSTGSTGMLTVNYQGSTPMVYSGALGGGPATSNFAFATTGSGVVVLDGSNTYTQGTTIGPGSTLQLGQADGNGNIVGNVRNNGSLVLNLANVSVFGGAISGTGSVTLMGNTTAYFTGPGSNYSGATFIQNGTLVASGSATSTNPLSPATAVVLGDSSNDTGILQLGDNSGPVNQTVAGLSSVGTGNNSVVGGNSGISTLSVNLASNSTFNGTLGGYSANQNNLALEKSGTAKLTLTGVNTYLGATTVNAGILEAGAPSAVSSSSAFIVNAAGTLRLSGNAGSVGSIAGAGTIENANAVAALLTTGNDNTNTTFSGVLENGTGGGALGLAKVGSGVLTLGGVNTYTGPTTVSMGALQLMGQSRLASPVSVANGAALDVSTAANTAVLASSLTLGSAPSDAMAMNFSIQSAWSQSVPMLTVSGGLTTNGTTTIDLSSSFIPTVGLYPLMKYGSISGSGTAGFSLGTLPSSRIQATLQDNPNTDVLYVNVTTSGAPVWTGAVNGNWDPTTANWALVGSPSTTTTYFPGDNVLFDDTAKGTTSLTLASAVAPSSVIFNSSLLTYSLSGAGAITGPGALIMSGSGLTVLATNNTYSGGTTISAGTLQLGGGGTSGSVTGNVTDNATLAFNRADNPTFAGTISGSGGLVQNGSGLTTLMASNTYSAETTISNGTLQLDNGGNTGMIAGNVVVNNNGTLVFARSDTVAYNGVISGNGAVTQAGPGTLIFNGNHSYTGLTTIGAGATLQIGSGGGSGSIVGDVAFPTPGNGSGTLVFARSDTVTYPGSASGVGQLIQQGTGNLILTGTNTQTLGTVFSSGTITVSSDANLGPGILTFYNGTLQAAAPLNLSAAALGPNGQTAAINTNGFDVTINGVTSPGLSVVKNGAGTLTLTNYNNSNTGTPPSPGTTFTVNAGALSVAVNTQVPTLQLILNGGVLQATANMGNGNPNAINGTEFNTGILIGPSGGTIDTGSNWFMTFTPITGNVGCNITKIGTGTWYVGWGLGNSGFNGNLNILAGTVLDQSANIVSMSNETDAIGNLTNVYVATGATWDDSWGNGEDLGQISGAGTVVIENGAFDELFLPISTTFSGSIRSASNGVISPNGSGNGNFEIDCNGSITLTGTTSDYGGFTKINGGTMAVGANVFPGQPGPFGDATGTAATVLLGDTGGTLSSALLVTSGGLTFGRSVQLQTGNTGTMTIGAMNTSGIVTFSGGYIYLGTSGAAAVPVTLTAAPGGTVVFADPIIRNTGATGSNDTVTVVGGGTIVFAGAGNNYQGATLIQNGTLVAAGGNNTLPVTTAVTLGDINNDSGVLQLGNGSGPVNQTVTGLAVVGSGSGNAVVGGYSAAPSVLTLNTSANGSYGIMLGGNTPTQNSLGFTLAGGAAITLTNSNSYKGPTSVSSGTLLAGSPSAFGVNSALTVSTGAMALLNGNSLTIGSLAGSGIVANANVAAALLTVGGDSTSTQFSGSIQDGAGGGALSLSKIGSGALTLSGTHTYSGPTTVSGGALQLLGAASLASGVTVNAGAGLGVLDTGAPTTANLGSTLTFGAASSDVTSLNFNLQGGWPTLTSGSSSLVLLNASRAVMANGTTTVNISSLTLPTVGEYTLLDYGSLTGQGSAGFTLGSLPSSQMSAKLLDVGNSLVLDVTAIDSSSWTGAHSSTWDVNTTANWKLVTSGSATTYAQGDNVQFSDTAANTAINLPGTVTPSTVQFSNNNLAYSISGTGKISGATSVVLTGSGLVTLNTNNDYTGGTYVNGGTVQLGSGGTTGSIVGTVQNNALLVFNRSDSPSFSGAISGSGYVAQVGGGVLTLLGSNTYTGLTTVSAGSLQIGNGGTSGSLAGNILNKTAAIFNRADTSVYGGAMSGNGALVQQGPGTTVLTGSNTYTGGTLINNGVLQIGNGGTSGSIVGNVLDNGTLIMNRFDNPTLSTSISGSGSLVQQGGGTLTLTGSNTYTGGTSIPAGTLQLGNGGTTGTIVGNVNIGGMLSVNQSGPVTLGGTLSGAGVLQQAGNGVTTVTGTNNTYGGGTNLNAGVLSINNNGSLGPGTINFNGGTLQITGQMGTGGPGGTNGTELSSWMQLNGTATIDTGSNWVTMTGRVYGGLGTTFNKIGSGAFYVNYGMGNSGFLGNVNIQAGSMVDCGVGFGTETDAFGDSTVVTVAAGATWDDSWGNGENLGGISGAGTILAQNSQFIWLEAPVSTTFSGTIHGAINSVVQGPGTGSTAFVQDGGGSITLTGTGSDFGGQTQITNGTIIVGANVIAAQPGPLGDVTGGVGSNAEILLGNTPGPDSATFLINTPGVQVQRPLRIESGNVVTVGGTNTSGTVYYTGQITIGTDGGTSVPLTITAAAGGTVEIDGNIVDGNSVAGATDIVTKIGGGTLVLTGNNTYQGGTVLAAGTLVLANGSNGSALGSGTLTLNGGTLAAGAAGGTISGPVQAGNGPHTIAPGAGLPAGQYGLLSLWGGLTTNANTTLAFNLGAPLSGGNYSGDLIDMGGSPLTVQGGNITFGTNPTAAGDYRLFENLGSTSNATAFSLPTPALIGTWTGTSGTASWNSHNWSTSGETYTLSTSADPGYLDLVVASTTANSPPAGGTVSFAGSPSAPITVTLDGNQSAGALVFNPSGSNGYTLSRGTGGTLTLGTSAGATIAANRGSQAINAPVVLAGGLVVTGSGTLAFGASSSIADNGNGYSLTMNGAGGSLILGGNDSYGGGTYVEAGTVVLTQGSALPARSSLTVGGGGTLIFDPSLAGSPAGGAASAVTAGVAAVPEPGSVALLVAAAAGFAAWRLRRRSAARNR